MVGIAFDAKGNSSIDFQFPERKAIPTYSTSYACLFSQYIMNGQYLM